MYTRTVAALSKSFSVIAWLFKALQTSFPCLAVVSYKNNNSKTRMGDFDARQYVCQEYFKDYTNPMSSSAVVALNSKDL